MLDQTFDFAEFCLVCGGMRGNVLFYKMTAGRLHVFGGTSDGYTILASYYFSDILK